MEGLLIYSVIVLVTYWLNNIFVMISLVLAVQIFIILAKHLWGSFYLIV